MALRRSVKRRWSWLASEQGCSTLGGRGKRRGWMKGMKIVEQHELYEGLEEVKLYELLEVYEGLECLEEVKLYELLETHECLECLAKIGTIN